MISFIGGTGPEGRGLALRFAIIGEQIFLGSRDPQRGVDSASDVRALLTVSDGPSVAGPPALLIS